MNKMTKSFKVERTQEPRLGASKSNELNDQKPQS